jgi:hypothetical protein
MLLTGWGALNRFNPAEGRGNKRLTVDYRMSNTVSENKNFRGLPALKMF